MVGVKMKSERKHSLINVRELLFFFKSEVQVAIFVMVSKKVLRLHSGMFYKFGIRARRVGSMWAVAASRQDVLI